VAVFGAIYLVGIIGAVVVGRARVGLSQRGRLSGATMMRSVPWFVTQMASMILWPIFLIVWLAKGRPESPWEAVTAGRDGSLTVRRRTN